MDQFMHIFPVVTTAVALLLIVSAPFAGARVFGSARMYWIVLSVLSFLTMISWGARAFLNISTDSSLAIFFIWFCVTLASLFFARRVSDNPPLIKKK